MKVLDTLTILSLLCRFQVDGMGLLAGASFE